MPNKYLASFQKAKEAYAQQKNRPGYVRTMFSSWRHKTTLNGYAAQLGSDLEREEKDDVSKDLIQKQFIDHKKDFNNHSFMMYFLDELVKDFPQEEWQQYNPKPIKLYKGELYRGTEIKPDIVFQKGFNESSPSSNVEDYTCYNTGSRGISTTKNYYVAQTYALPMVRPMHDTSLMEARYVGYVYKINYRGCTGIDIEGTASERAKHDGSSPKTGKKEVNIVGNVKPCDIVCAFLVKRNGLDKPEIVKTFPNPFYESEHKEDENRTLISCLVKR